METVESLLLDYLNNLKKKNPKFSLRAFAKKIDMSPSHLSSIINKRKKLSPKQAIQIIKKLELDAGQSLKLLEDVHPELKQALKTKVEQKILSDDQFKLISDWVHFAILSLSFLPDSQASSKWISKKLNVSESRIASSFLRLQKMGLIQVFDKKYTQTLMSITTTRDISSSAIRENHRQNLEMAQQKLQTIDVLQREYGSITFPLNIRDIQKAKDLITEFKLKFYNEIKTSDPTDVYTLAIQLFPLTQPETKKEKDNLV